MFGIILSKAAAQYASMAVESGIATTDFYANDTIENLTSMDLSRAQWLLAEPSLAISVLDQLPNLRWLQSTWAGVERLIESSKSNYTLTNVRGVFAPLMTEYVLAHCLAYERQILAHHSAQQNQKWHNETTGGIRGKTILILGIGSIGLGIAQTMHYLGLRVLGVVKKPRKIEPLAEVGSFSDLPRLLNQADYVVNVLPNTPDTQNFINHEFLNQMKPSALFINVGRGQAVAERDLAAALTQGTIAHAVLDVYQTEPLPADHFFWHTPHLTLTSHTAAPSFPADIFNIFIDNYWRFSRGEPLKHTVDFERGY